MTEEEKEAIYQRALGRRRVFLRVLAAVLIGLLAFLLVRCHARPFYSEQRVRSILEERYGCAVTVHRQPGELNERYYRAVCEAWPGLEFSVRDVWYEGCWDSLLPVWHFPRHEVEDYLRAAAWNAYALPILAEYGLEVEVAGDRQWYNGRRAGSNGTLVPLGTDLDALAADLTEAIARLRGAPVFSDLLERGERIGYWSVPVCLSAGEELSVEEPSIYAEFPLDTDWTEEEVRAELGKLAERLEKLLAQQKMGRR